MEIDIRRAAQEDLDAAEQLYNDVCSALEAGFAQSAAESYRSGAPFLPAPAQAQAFAAFLLPSIFHPDFFGQNI